MAPTTTFEGLVCVVNGYRSNVVTRREGLVPGGVAPIADASVNLAARKIEAVISELLRQIRAT
ncbi:MAG: hypothetical protein U0V87_15615 [Acidobacteriota bacterium]